MALVNTMKITDLYSFHSNNQKIYRLYTHYGRKPRATDTDNHIEKELYQSGEPIRYKQYHLFMVQCGQQNSTQVIPHSPQATGKSDVLHTICWPLLISHKYKQNKDLCS